MSNVIIGIMGVILFIGLALAGASFLGDRFTDASHQRNATIALSSARQFAAAVQIYNTRNRGNLRNALDNGSDLVSSGILKSMPANPIAPGNTPFTIGSDGGLTSGRPAFVLMYLGQSQAAMDACIEIERGAGKTDRLDPSVMGRTINFFDRANSRTVGCHRNSAGFGSNGGAAGDYLLYMPV